MVIFTDGSSRWHGRGCYAIWAFVAFEDNGVRIGHRSGVMGPGRGMIASLAEYTAVIKALEWARGLRARGFRICTDSELIVKQVQGDHAVANHQSLTLAEKTARLLNRLEASIEWISRQDNGGAHGLCEEAFRRATK